MSENSIRTKVVPIDNLNITISELTFDQVQAYLAPIERQEGMDDAQYADQMRIRALEMICNSMNNVLRDGEVINEETYEQKKWTPARFCAKYGFVTFRKLNNEVLLFSGLQLLDTPVGGALASADSTLATSGLASLPQPASAGAK